MTMGSIGFTNKDVRRIEIKNADGTSAGTITITKSAKKKKKKLQYNFKYISTQIMQTKTSVNARQVIASARQYAVSLRRRMGSGDYDERELRSAILHAETMVRVAKKRMKHLQQEENIKAESDNHNYEYEDDIDIDETEELLEENRNTEADADQDMEARMELLREYRKIMQETMEELMQDTIEEVEDAEADDIEKLSEELMVNVRKEMSPSDLEKLKKKHRSDELREIMEADMKYLKAMFDKLEKERQDSGSGIMGSTEGVALELGGMEIPVQITEPPVVTEGGNVDTIV